MISYLGLSHRRRPRSLKLIRKRSGIQDTGTMSQSLKIGGQLREDPTVMLLKALEKLEISKLKA